MVTGMVTAEWITMSIEVTLQQQAAKPTSQRGRGEVKAVTFNADRDLHMACLAEAGIPDKHTGCSHVPQP